MLKSLRRRFLTITMLSILFVLIVLIAIINIVNRYNSRVNADDILDVIAETGMYLPSQNSDLYGGGTSYSTRYFFVLIYNSGENEGEIADTDISHILDIEEEEANLLALQLYNEQSKSRGYIEKYRYLVITSTYDMSSSSSSDVVYPCNMYIFLDWSSELSSCTYFLWTSILISIVAYVIIYIVIIFLADRILSPITDNYEKQKKFITDAGHDLKTPLSIINANADVIEMESGESEWTQSIKNQVERLSSLTNKLVYLANMNEKEERMNFTKFSISDTVIESAEGFIAIAQVEGKTFDMDIKPNLTFYGDEVSINQLVVLLLDNAMKYSNENGNIKLKLSGTDKSITINVYNTVDEISIGRHDELFERFYRGDLSRNSQTGGQGIGLSVVKTIVDVHKGKIRCESVDGKSIQFTVLL